MCAGTGAREHARVSSRLKVKGARGRRDGKGTRMRIGELARLTGLAPSAIRYYEERDMFSPGQVIRLRNGYRDYTPQARRRLELVLAGRAAGFSLDDMRHRMEHWEGMPDSERVAILAEQQERLEERIAALAASRDGVLRALEMLRAREADAERPRPRDGDGAEG